VDAVSGAEPAVYALPTVSACAAVEALTASRGPPSAPAARREIERVRAVLARAEAYELAGQASEALALVEPLREPVRALGWAPLELELGEQRARLQAQLSDHMTEAEATYDDALRRAATSRDDHAAVSLWVDLIAALAGNLGKPLEALAQRRSAELALARIHASANDLKRADLAQHVAFAAWRAGRFDEAKNLARASLAVRERVLGKDHLDVASSLVVLALALQDAGDLDGAAAAGERALSVRRAALGNDHPKVGISLDELAVIRVLQGRLDEAVALHREALAVQERVLGPDHPDLGMSLNNLGSLHLDMGRFDEAERLLTRALSIWQRSLSPVDPDFAIVYQNLGQVALGRGDAARAREACSEALRIDQAALGADTPVLAWEYTCLGDAALLAGTPRVALPLLERALKLRVGAPALERADTQIALARALSALHLEPERALALARMAHATFAEAGPVAAVRLERSERLLLGLEH
jgi:serine/threonine-protein kinase